jgi:hypothetical protein
MEKGNKGCFKQGRIPWNKGLRGVNFGGKTTQFKPGHRGNKWVPLGTERIGKDGCIEVKVRDEKSKKNWKSKHAIIWEKHNNQSVPEGHVIIFGDSDNRNFDPNNLILVSRKQLIRMNQNGLIKDDTELTKSGVIIADIYNKVGQLRKNKKGGNHNGILYTAETDRKCNGISG